MSHGRSNITRSKYLTNLTLDILLITGGEGATDSIILEEEIDPNYVPSEDEVIEYAKWLGMDLNTDPDLVWIAREGLMVRNI